MKDVNLTGKKLVFMTRHAIGLLNDFVSKQSLNLGICCECHIHFAMTPSSTQHFAKQRRVKSQTKEVLISQI